MKMIRSIYSTLAALSLGAFATACGGVDTNASVDQAGLESVDPTLSADAFGTVDEAITACDDHQYDHWRYLADLGIVAAQELGRWEPTIDFVNTGASTGLALSAAGLARCGSNCDNINAILSLQTNGTGIIPRHDANLFRSKLLSFFDRQQIFDRNNGVLYHDLTSSYISTATCGSRYWFKALTNPSTTVTTNSVTGTAIFTGVNSGMCIDVKGGGVADGALMQQYTCRQTANQKFTFQASGDAYKLIINVSGKCMRAMSDVAGANLEQRSCDSTNNQLFDLLSAGNGRYMLKNRAGGMCVEIAGNSTAINTLMVTNNCNPTSTSQHFSISGVQITSKTTTVQTTGTPVPLANPAALSNSLTWLGGTENTYLAFQTSGSEVSIDPMGTMVDGAAGAQSGSCYVGTSSYDPTRTSAGKCCTFDGFYGKLTASPFNPSIYYCK
jgi:hypothetical protein